MNEDGNRTHQEEGVSMERIKSLNRYQKFLLLFMLAMVLCFTVLYPITISRKGFLYRDTILVPRQENGATLYSAKLRESPPVLRYTQTKE